MNYILYSNWIQVSCEILKELSNLAKKTKADILKQLASQKYNASADAFFKKHSAELEGWGFIILFNTPLCGEPRYFNIYFHRVALGVKESVEE